MADSGVGVMTCRPTGYIGAVISWLTVKWWANGSADSGDNGLAERVHWSDDQSADSGVVGLMGQPTGYIGVMVGQQWGDGVDGAADRVYWSDHQLANSEVVG